MNGRPGPTPGFLFFAFSPRVASRYSMLNQQSLAYVYSRDHPHIAKVLTEDEARRIASNIAKLPQLLGKQ
jgi:hypothetical protein